MFDLATKTMGQGQELFETKTILPFCFLFWQEEAQQRNFLLEFEAALVALFFGQMI